MKKLLAIVMIVLFTACNSTEEKTNTTADSTSTESPLMDAVNTRDSASKIIQDSTGKMIDTPYKK
jgi:hypothetical protein